MVIMDLMVSHGFKMKLVKIEIIYMDVLDLGIANRGKLSWQNVVASRRIDYSLILEQEFKYNKYIQYNICSIIRYERMF